jgi:hypothetical protein
VIVMAIDSSSLRSRRAVLLGAIGGVAASVVAAVGRASHVDAANGDIVKVGHTYSATTRTAIKVDTTQTAFFGSSPSGYGIHGYSANDVGVYGSNESLGIGVKGKSTTGKGVQGISSSDAGVRGDSDIYSGVLGWSGSGIGVDGRSTSGPGMWGKTAASNLPGVLGQSTSDGTGVQGFSGMAVPGATPAKTGVFGSASQDSSSVGIRGASSTGRGAILSGKVAQLRLQPSAAGTHPASGAAGDLFLDSSARLWLCQGATAWVRVA